MRTPSMHPFISTLEERFAAHANRADATAMRAYMKDRFPFFGIKTPMKRALMKEHLAATDPPSVEDLPAIARSAFARPQRETHYVAVDLLMGLARKLGPEHLPLVEELILTNSWWDTVDALAVNVAGVILRGHRKETAAWNARWIDSPEMWLNRNAILYQLKWKGDTDQELLFANIRRLAGHPDFFIRKAIGWALRELAKTEPRAVRAFVRSGSLAPLSVREALKNL